jgi:hypothetical protein
VLGCGAGVGLPGGGVVDGVGVLDGVGDDGAVPGAGVMGTVDGSRPGIASTPGTRRSTVGVAAESAGVPGAGAEADDGSEGHSRATCASFG